MIARRVGRWTGLVFMCLAQAVAPGAAAIGLVLDGGLWVLEANRPSQHVTLFLENHDDRPVAVGGFDLALEIADGGPDGGGRVKGPVITGVNLLDGTLFDGHVARPVRDPASTGQQQYWMLTLPVLGIAPSLPARSRVPLAVLEIDTTGLFAGVFALNLAGTGLGDSSAVDAFGVRIVDFEVRGGALRLASRVAEGAPGVGLIAGLAALWILRWHVDRDSAPLGRRRSPGLRCDRGRLPCP